MTESIPPLSEENSAEPPKTEILLIQRQGEAIDRMRLDSPVVTLGRDVRNDIVLDSEAVSRLHARLESDQGLWYVTDLGSMNGTFLNDEKLSAYAPQAIEYNDQLKFGEFEIVFQRLGSIFGDGNIRGEGTVLIKPEVPAIPEVSNAIDETISGAVEMPVVAEDEAPEVVAKEETVDQISLARQLFGGLDEYERTPLPEPPTMPMPKVVVTPYSFSIWPTVLLHSGQVMVSILNESSRTQQFEIEVMGAEGVAVAQEKLSAEIPAGSEHRARVNLRAISRPLMGDQRKYPYKVRVSAENGEARESTGDILVEPRMTTAMVIFAVGLSLTLVLVWIASQLL